ncbi:hypothetical protein CCP3SC1AL1_4750001 [Gammaproteobacteria bacterium]
MKAKVIDFKKIEFDQDGAIASMILLCVAQTSIGRFESGKRKGDSKFVIRKAWTACNAKTEKEASLFLGMDVPGAIVRYNLPKEKYWENSKGETITFGYKYDKNYQEVEATASVLEDTL